ncbi:MAG: anthranilate phosphoribosyltransferase [Catonella sp.]|nr:anthranilate phosphoribosyltransferase [Catonella sp.]MDY6357215.1 anthranilate phosphoribosyltransferase [Catonella sp.]
MIEKAITAVSGGRNLTYSEATDAMKEIVNGTATPAQIGAYVTALHMKGETIDELAASAEVMRSESKAFNGKGDILDIVGIGGDEINTFNISTAAMFVVAASGITVAKHVSRSSAKTTNSGDVLVKLGINLNVPAAVSEELLANDGLCFLYANEYHKAFETINKVKNGLGFRNMFNTLEALSNPARADMQLLGVTDPELLVKMAKVLSKLGVVRGLVVCGNDEIDEVTLSGPTSVCEIRYGGRFVTYEINPEDYGFRFCELKDLMGGTVDDNAKILTDILTGKENGPKKDVVVLNAGMAIYLGKDGYDMEQSFDEARDIIDSGKAYDKLVKYRNDTALKL